MERGTTAYRRASAALFLAGFATFSLLYCVQPLLPAFATSFRLAPATASLPLSLTTAALAVSILAAGALSQAAPRRALMFAAMALAAGFNLLAALAPSWTPLLAARLLEGAALGGVPAVAMTYLAEEMHPRDLGKAMGLYVAGTAFGGMMGRVGMGMLLEWMSWRSALTTVSLLDMAAAIGFVLLLPTSRNFVVQKGFDWRQHVGLWRRHLRHPGLLRLFGVGFVLTSVFVSLFNYAGFRLSGAPYDLSEWAISMIFLTYISGMVISPFAGQATNRFGRRAPLMTGLTAMGVGALLTLSDGLPLIVLGILLVTVGFFAAHAVTSSWIGVLGADARGHASSLYLLFYYMGSSIVGSIGGWFWQHLGWTGVVGMALTVTLAGLMLAAGSRDVGGTAHD